ncbi:TPA: hypothetical protein QDZ28_002395 [Pseudomonas putida]|nr:hypothetical protein [Pseudomonas putida]
MLHLVTEQEAGEPDILSVVMHSAFEIRSLAGDVLVTVPAPESGWTHAQLVATAVEHEAVTPDGADGYLGGQWVGSTEI